MAAFETVRDAALAQLGVTLEPTTPAAAIDLVAGGLQPSTR
jgi:hypothetical protein